MADDEEVQEGEPQSVGAWLRANGPLLLAVGAAMVSSVGSYFTLGTEVRVLREWRTGHEVYHRERAAELAVDEGRNTARIESIEGQLRKIDELSFRIGAAEQSTRSTAEAIAKLQTAVTDQAADIRVMREILERLDTRRADLARPNRTSP